MSYKGKVHISMVKKIKLNGTDCRKCADIMERLDHSGLIKQIDQIIVADERDPESEGMQLAEKHSVDSAPFFIVTGKGGAVEVYTTYFKLVRDVLQKPLTNRDELMELTSSSAVVDYI